MRRCPIGGTCEAPLYLHGDHLGSVSLVTDSNEGIVSETRYLPYGEERWTSGESSPTDFGYTGQRKDGFGLMDYNARYYNAKLGRFISADSIVPDPANAKSFDRYAYVYNNPTNFNDPSGHCVICGIAYIIYNIATDLTQQGYHEVVQNQQVINNAAQAHNVSEVLLAASIMNQGNSYQRPGGIEIFEMVQVFAPFESKYTGEHASAGVAQLMTWEIEIYVPGCDASCLFDDEMSIYGMAGKIESMDKLLPSDMNPTDRFMILAIAQNGGAGEVNKFLAANLRWEKWYTDEKVSESSRRQLIKILRNIQFLIDQGLYTLPEEIDLDYWQSIIDSEGQTQPSVEPDVTY